MYFDTKATLFSTLQVPAQNIMLRDACTSQAPSRTEDGGDVFTMHILILVVKVVMFISTTLLREVELGVWKQSRDRSLIMPIERRVS